MNKIICVCCTPYQLLNAINLKITKYRIERYDLILVNRFKEAKSYYEILRKKNFFDKVYFCDEKQENLEKERKIIINLTVKDYIEGFKVEDYSELIIGNYSYFSDILFSEIKRLNNKVIVNILEDGVGSYTREIGGMRKEKRIINKILGKSFIRKKDIKNSFVYSKSLVSFKTNYNFIQTPVISDDVFDKIVDLLEIERKKIKAPKVIYFDQPFMSDGINIDETKVVKNLLKEYKEVTIKLHPRQLESRYENINNINFMEDLKMPWEIAIKFIDNIEECKFITVNSTAVFTPSILCGMKVDIRLLNDKFKDNKKYDAELFIEKFKKEYL